MPVLLSLFALILLNAHCPTAARTAAGGKPVVLQIHKDQATGQYTTVVKQRTPAKPTTLVVDLGLASSWVDCDQPYVSSTFLPVRCGSPACKLAKTAACTTQCFGPRRPGCTNNTCAAFPENTVTRLSTGGDFIQDVLTVATADGGSLTADRFVGACGADILLKGLAGGALGMLSLSRSPLALPAQLAAAFRIPRKVAICLPSSSSSSANGAALVGELSSASWPLLTYTRLLVSPVSTAGASTAGQKSDEYFIAVKSILVSGKPVNISAALLTIDKNGDGGTKISTATPYTVLETSIYAAVTAAFRAAMGGAPRVPPAPPLELCYDASKIRTTATGPAVPEIVFVVAGGGGGFHWRVVGANSMAAARKGALCLGVVDGGKSPRTAVVIGGLQMEDNLIAVDLERSMLGFSSSLLLRGKSCSDHGFMIGSDR